MKRRREVRNNRTRWVYFGIILLYGLLSTSITFAIDDKQQHFRISALFGAASEIYLRTEDFQKAYLDSGEMLEPSHKLWLSTAIGSTPGLAKEILDSTQTNNSFSSSDMVANVAGAFVGALLSHYYHASIQFKMEGGPETSLAITWRYPF